MTKSLRILATLALVCIAFWDLRISGSFQVNSVFLEYMKVFCDPGTLINEKIAALRWINGQSDQVIGVLSPRQKMVLSSVSRIIYQSDRVQAQKKELGESELMSPATWYPYFLPSIVPLDPNLKIAAAMVLSNELDYAFGTHLHLALLLQPINPGLNIQRIHPSAEGWRVFASPAGLVAIGSVPNMIANPGFEMPNTDPFTIQGILPTTYWGGYETRQRLRLAEPDKGVPNQAACIAGDVRLSVPFKSVSKGAYLLFGAKWRATRGAGSVPFLIALNPVDDSSVFSSTPSVLQVMGEWTQGYGIQQSPSNAKVSLFLDGRGGNENETCIDDLFLAILPSFKLLSVDSVQDTR